MAKPIVYVLDPYHPAAISALQATDWIEVRLPDDPRKAQWHEDAVGIIVRSDSQIAANDITRAESLKVVVKQGVGVDNIDLDAARQAGVAVHNTPALNSESVAELVLALTLSIARRIPEFDRKLRDGQKIVRSQMLGLSLFRKSVGIIGMGNIGREVATKFAGACAATIIAYDPIAPPDAWTQIPHTRVTNLDDLLRQSDVVTLHIPLLDSTRNMIGKRELGLMREKAILVNASRGGIVDETALAESLGSGKLWGAVLDAVEVEPPTKESCAPLLELGNVIVTPHVGASTEENQTNSGLAVVQTLLGVLKGEEGVSGKLV